MVEKEKHYTQEEKKDGAQQKIEETEKILEMSEISIWLDNYDDIFSDFDPRPYSQRSLSDDFLTEAKKVSRGKSGDKLELRLLIPEQQRNLKDETIIRKRLRDHFSRHSRQLHDEIANSRKTAALLVLLGISMMLSATYIYSYFPDRFIYKFLFVLLEPAGWFTTWFALDKMFYTSEAKKPEYNFYQKMAKCEVIFSSY